MQKIKDFLFKFELNCSYYDFPYGKIGVGMSTIHDGKKMVYLLISNRNIKYIGCSKELSVRLSKHRTKKKFNKIIVIESVDEQHMLLIEALAIKYFNPKLNILRPIAVADRHIFLLNNK